MVLNCVGSWPKLWPIGCQMGELNYVRLNRIKLWYVKQLQMVATCCLMGLNGVRVRCMVVKCWLNGVRLW